jgi:hypothetical protein
LRYTIARALALVEAPAFDSVADLSAALARHEPSDPAAIVRALYVRAVSASPVREADRRRPRVSVAMLRQQLRQADEEMFSQLNRTATIEAAAEPTPVTPSADRWRHHSWSSGITEANPRVRANWGVAGALAVSLSFAAGYAVVASVRAAHVTPPTATAPATEPAPAPGGDGERAIANASRPPRGEKH